MHRLAQVVNATVNAALEALHAMVNAALEPLHVMIIEFKSFLDATGRRRHTQNHRCRRFK